MNNLILSTAPKHNYAVTLNVQDSLNKKEDQRYVLVSSFRALHNRTERFVRNKIIEKMEQEAGKWDALVDKIGIQVSQVDFRELADKQEVGLFSRQTKDFLDLESHEVYPRPTNDHLMEQTKNFKTFEFIEDFEDDTEYLCIVSNDSARIGLGLLRVENKKHHTPYELIDHVENEISTSYLLEMIKLNDLTSLPYYYEEDRSYGWTAADDLPDGTGSLGLAWVAYKDATGESSVALTMAHLTKDGLVVEPENFFDMSELEFMNPAKIEGFEILAVKNFSSEDN